MKRTSITHPLQIAAVAAGADFGRIGVTFCPGKFDPDAQTGSWDRDLALDLDAIRDWGAAAVVTLLEPKELRLLRVPQLADEVERRGMEWFHLPIVDVSTPDKEFEHAWKAAGEELRSMLKDGKNVLVHCRGGLGRAGTIAARLLIELGMEPKQAIARVRAERPGAIETRDQERFLVDLVGRQVREGRATDWFQRLTGFREASYDDTRGKLELDGTRLKSLVNGRSYCIGELELVSLAALRERTRTGEGPSGRLRVEVAIGDVREMHRLPENAGALFQVASQFNLLEMVSPSVTPEQGVTRYQNDRTQGPACAIACGAATIYRNYFTPVGGSIGQTALRQLDGLAGIGKILAETLGEPVHALWEMRNGYALASRSGLDAISQHLAALPAPAIDDLRGQLSIGIHRDVEVTDAPGDRRPLVSQAFCSALPVAYTGVAAQHWERFACLILEAAYEATILAGILNARHGASKVVLLTQLGGGAFGNREEWVLAAVRRALRIGAGFDLEVKLVSYGNPSPGLLEMAEAFS